MVTTKAVGSQMVTAPGHTRSHRMVDTSPPPRGPIASPRFETPPSTLASESQRLASGNANGEVDALASLYGVAEFIVWGQSNRGAVRSRPPHAALRGSFPEHPRR